MKIGNKEYPDNCPDCNQLLIKNQLNNDYIDYLKNNFSKFVFIEVKCSKCKFKYDTVKIRKDYLSKEIDNTDNIEDVTPYKISIINKILAKILYFYYEKI